MLTALVLLALPRFARAEDHVRIATGASLTIPPLPTGYVRDSHDFGSIAYEPRAKERVSEALASMGNYRHELRQRFGHDVLGDVEVRVVSTPEEMRALAPREVAPPTYAVGVAYPSVKLVLVSLIEPRSFQGTDLAEVLKHELVHVALDEAVDGARVPRWFNEGTAIYLSGENAGERIGALAQASISNSLIPITQLDRQFGEDGAVTTAYAESADFVRFLQRSEDQDRFRSLVDRVRGGAPFERALEDAYATKLGRLEYQWREQVSHRYAYGPAIFASSFVWILVIGALVWAYWKKRHRAKTILARWEKEEADEDAIVAELSALPRPSPLGFRTTTIEQNGRFYDLH